MYDQTSLHIQSKPQRVLIIFFVLGWIVLQVVFPFFQKFELPSLKFRYARFSWGMYSRLVPVYEMRFLRINSAGQEEAIPDINHYVKGYQSPDPMIRRAIYAKPEEILNRQQRLVTFMAEQHQDGYRYKVNIRWIKYADPNVPEQWEFQA